MDQLLKARKLSSASARRKRVQEREDEQDLAFQRYEHHRRRILYDQVLDEADGGSGSGSNSGSDGDQEMGVARLDRESSVETPSECSVLTPDDTPSIRAAFEKSGIRSRSPISPSIVHIFQPEGSIDFDGPATEVPPSPMPKLQASLVALCDFNYQRFSAIMDFPPQLQSAPDLDTDEEYSPIQTARPVSFRQPKSRPSVISITGISNRTRKRTISIQSPLTQTEVVPASPSPPPPPPPPRSAKRLSQISTRSGFLASEAKPMEVPDLPMNAVSIIASASRESVAISPSPAQKSVQKKPSAPLLLGALKTSHARMTSMKMFIKSPSHIHTPSESSLTRPGSRQSRPSTSAADAMTDFTTFETVPKILNDPPVPRPRTATRPPTRGSTQSSVTALPILPPPPSIEQSERELLRKKSFSKLRKRSESIGQAIKFATMKSKTPTSANFPLPLPPTPKLVTPNLKPSIDLLGFPTPPLSGPSITSRKSANYGMFPPSPRADGPVGLGLKI